MTTILKSSRTKPTYAFVSLFFVVVLGSYCSVCLSQTVEDHLLKRRVSLRVKDGTIEEALNRLVGEQSVPIGWETSLSDFVRHDINVDMRNTALKDVLDYLVLAEPSYRWKLEDGVINFVPVIERDELFEKFLSLRIKQFEPPKGLSVFAFRDAILDLPEVQSFLQSNGLGGSHTGHLSGTAPPPLDFEFRVADTDLRALLNKLIRDGHRRMWILSRNGPRRELLHLAL